jgi:hypothetical protein
MESMCKILKLKLMIARYIVTKLEVSYSRIIKGKSAAILLIALIRIKRIKGQKIE